MELLEWQKRHADVMHAFLTFINQRTDQFILKGGTALFGCYGLDRFSEDLDFDGKRQDIKELVKHFCQAKGFTFRVAKDTPMVSRCFVNYGEEKLLKIEVSYRNTAIRDDAWTTIDGIRVYKIEQLARMKTSAYQARDRIRDLYDIGFICQQYFECLPDAVKDQLRDALSYKGIEQFDYMVRTQPDPLINVEKMADNFLSMHERLGLLVDNQPIQQEEEKKRSRGR